nr:retrovirus-related Pol polyprotein from transposon TNT 1-94 [Tanacetum cinerariifolium]
MQYCKENGIARQLTAPYSPQQNRVVERRNKTIMSTTKCMMKATNMPKIFWAEAVRYAIHILNSVLTKAIEDITLYEAIERRKPNLENLRVFGCIAYAKIPSQHLTKLDDGSTRMVYLGNEQGSKAYRLFDLTTHRICVSRDVKFKENEIWVWKDYMSGHINDEPEWTLTSQHNHTIKTKRDTNGNIIKHKARLVTKGYIKEHGIDFEEVFASVARMETIRLLLAIAANNKWEVHHLDIKSAILHEDLKKKYTSHNPKDLLRNKTKEKSIGL